MANLPESIFLARRPSRNAQALIFRCFPHGGRVRLGSYSTSLDVYGSYFPAWLICLIAGVILTIFVSLIGRVFDLSLFRRLGLLLPISLILIFSITIWFLFFTH
jgi:hypothetical protein